MSDQTIVLITGGNTGLGLEIVKALCRAKGSYHIIIGSRKVSNGETAIEAVKKEYPDATATFEVVQADLESDDSLSKAIETIDSKHGRLDVLVNNGGGNFETRMQAGELGLREGWLASWNTNVAGTHVLTTFAMPLLLKSSKPRLMFMTSGTSTLAETDMFDTQPRRAINASPEKGWPKPKQLNPITSYRSAKCGLNMMMREWHRILLNDGVKVWCISPGFLATSLNGIPKEQLMKMGAQDPSEGGNFVVSVIEGSRDADVGKVIRANMVQPW